MRSLLGSSLRLLTLAVVCGGATVVARAAPASAGDSPPSTASPVIEIAGEADVVPPATAVLGVEARTQSGGSLIQIRTDGAVARYEVNEAHDPERLFVDLYGLSTRKNVEQTFTGSAVTRARIGKHSDKVRIVLETGETIPHYDVAATNEGLTLLFSTDAAASTAQTSSAVRSVSLDKKNGFWRLRMDVGDAVSVRSVKNSPSEKIVALDGIKLDAQMLGSRGLAGGPIGDVSFLPDDARKDSMRVRVAFSGAVENSVWQRDGVVYWDVRSADAPAGRVQPAAAPFVSGAFEATSTALSSATYRGKKITIDLMDADIVNVIRLLGDVSGKNVVVAEDVRGKVTLKLKSVPWDQAMDVILKTKDLGQETKGGIIRVVQQSKLDAERDARLRQRDEMEKKLPTTVRLIPVNYAIAASLVPQIKELLSTRGKATFDQRTNVIIVEDIHDNVEQAERLVRTLDTQTPQVLIEARMVEGNTSFSRSLGIQWGGGLFFSQRGGNPTGLIFPNQVGVAGGAQGTDVGGDGVPNPSNWAVNLPATTTTSGIGMNLGSIGNFGFLNARLTAAESADEVRTISSPRVTTLNNKPAIISQGQDILIAIPGVNGAPGTVQVVPARLELNVTPHVTADGSILLEVNLQNDSIGGAPQGGGTPPLNRKRAQAELLVNDGDTAVIGGIFTRTQRTNMRQLPFLGSIPLLGWLFKSTDEADNRNELLIFMTPRIVNRASATVQGGAFK